MPNDRMEDVACFFDVNVDDAKLENFDPPDELVDSLIGRLERQQMLVLGGRALEDKRLFAKHLAWHLSAKNGQPIPVKQWCPGLRQQDFAEALRLLPGETILWFPDVLPHKHGHGLLRCLRRAILQHDKKGGRHFAIATTDSELADWGGEALEKLIWSDQLKTGDIYSPDFLKSRLSFELQGCDALQEAGLSIEELVRKLRTPSRVRDFADLIKDNHESITLGWIDKILGQLSGEGTAVGEWFDNLSPRHRTLALGLALLDGLFRDQALAVLDILVIEVWRHREPNFPCFATSELSLLGAFFRGTSEGDQAEQVTCLSARHREAILRAAWNWNGNMVGDALPKLADLATWSGPFGAPAGMALDGAAAAGGEENESTFADRLPPGYVPRLYGTPERVRQIQWTVSVALSEIGKRISKIPHQTVSNVLLGKLAANQETDPFCKAAAHCVAAAALALWREPEALDVLEQKAEKDGDIEEKKRKEMERRENQFFDTLERWYGKEAPKLGEGVKATVALSVGYAARFDQPNELPPRLLVLFEELCRDESPLVRELARLHMVPAVAELHLSQVEPFLREKLSRETENEGQIRLGLALGLAAACSFQPDEAVPVLGKWYKEGLEAFRRSSAAKNRLIAAILAYSWLAADDLDGKRLPMAGISGRLRKVIRRDQAIRESVVDVLKIQLSRDPERVVPVFGALLKRLTRQELGSLARCLTALHVQERGKQKDAWLLTNPDYTPILTGIEKGMAPWIRERSCTAACRIALRALLEISALRPEVERRERLAEREWIADVERKRKTRFGRLVLFLRWGRRDPIQVHGDRWKLAEEREKALRERPMFDVLLTSAFLRFAVFWATILSLRDRAVVQAQLAELLDYWKSAVSIQREPRKWLARIFDRYEGHSEDLEPIIGHLVRAVWLFRHRWSLVVASGLVLASLAFYLYVP